jgi:hypothetical protein
MTSCVASRNGRPRSSTNAGPLKDDFAPLTHRS